MAKSSYKSTIYAKTYSSFAGSDITAVFTPQGGSPHVIGEIQTVSYSMHRPTMPVYALGQKNAKGIVRGARTIAGSLIFTVFDRHVLYEVVKDIQKNRDTIMGKDCPVADGYMKSDELPPFDVSIHFLNEYGESSLLTIKGVHLMSEGQTMSIEDLITENVMEFIAMDIELMKPDSHEEPGYDNWMQPLPEEEK